MAICLWIKSILEVKLKNLGLMLVEEISGQLSTDSVVCLVAMILMHINSEKREVGQEKYKMYNLKRKTVSRNAMLQPSLVLKDITNLKKSLIQNGIKGEVTSGQDPTQLILEIMKGKCLRDFQGSLNNNSAIMTLDLNFLKLKASLQVNVFFFF